MSTDPTEHQRRITAHLDPLLLRAALRGMHRTPAPEDARGALEQLYVEAATRAGLSTQEAREAAHLRAKLVIEREREDRRLLHQAGAPARLIRRQPGLTG